MCVGDTEGRSEWSNFCREEVLLADTGSREFFAGVRIRTEPMNWKNGLEIIVLGLKKK